VPGPRQPASGGRGGHARRLVALEAASQIRRSPGWLERRWSRASWRLSRPTCRRRAARDGEDASASERPEPEREAVRLPPKACLDRLQVNSAERCDVQGARRRGVLPGPCLAWAVGHVAPPPSRQVRTSAVPRVSVNIAATWHVCGMTNRVYMGADGGGCGPCSGPHQGGATRRRLSGRRGATRWTRWRSMAPKPGRQRPKEPPARQPSRSPLAPPRTARLARRRVEAARPRRALFVETFGLTEPFGEAEAIGGAEAFCRS
jgi:hypothetical protein